MHFQESVILSFVFAEGKGFEHTAQNCCLSLQNVVEQVYKSASINSIFNIFLSKAQDTAPRLTAEWKKSQIMPSDVEWHDNWFV